MSESQQYQRYMRYLAAHERWVIALDSDHFAKGAPSQGMAMENAWASYLEAGGSTSDAIHY